MKVLWFSNTPSLGASYLNDKSIGGGWIESLEAAINKTPNFELGIIFKCLQPNMTQFIAGKTKYFPISMHHSTCKVKKISDRWFHKIENDEYIQQYLNVIQSFNPDIIHIFGTESDFGLIIPKLSIPCIIHLQGNLTVINYKWYSDFTVIDILKYSNKWNLLKGFGLFHSYYYQKKAAEREKKIYKVCQYYMGRTDWDRRVSSVLAPSSKYFHCDEIMRPGFYLHQWQPSTKQTNYIIFTTIRGNIYKGLKTIYECKKILNRNILKYKITWRIAGIIQEDEISYLVERKFNDSLLANSIQLLGPLGENQLIAEMLQADLFVHPSHIDNSPNSVCEAMLIGMPVIATFAGGIPSVISDKIEGILVQDGDPYALAGAIVEMLNNRDQARNIGTNARRKALIRHNPDRILSDVLKIYSSLISKKVT